MRLPHLLNLHLFLTTLFPFPLTLLPLPLSSLSLLFITHSPILPMMLHIRVFREHSDDGRVGAVIFQFDETLGLGSAEEDGEGLVGRVFDIDWGVGWRRWW